MTLFLVASLLAPCVVSAETPPPAPYDARVEYSEGTGAVDVFVNALRISEGELPQPPELPVGMAVIDPRTLPCEHRAVYGDRIGLGTCVGLDGNVSAGQFDPYTMPMILDDTGEWVYEGLAEEKTVAWSSAVAHTLTATVLDTPVEVRLTPISWEWHFGQEIPDFITTTPGGQYPDLSVSGVYTDVEQGLTVTATITWQGEYRRDDSLNWYLVFGAGSTAVFSEPFDTYEYRTYLIPSPDYDGPGPESETP